MNCGIFADNGGIWPKMARYDQIGGVWINYGGICPKKEGTLL